ncbi:unnamed protein product [Urochloa humidicola]
MADKAEKPIIRTLRDALLHFAVKSKKLASPLLEPFGRRAAEPATVDDNELAALKSKLSRISAVLRDAENLSVTDRSVQLWLTELGDLEHRAEDVLEELEYESRRSAQLEELKQDLLCASTTGKRRREAAMLFAAAPARRLRRKIDGIWARYEEIASDRKKLRLHAGDSTPRPPVSPLLPSSALPHLGRGELHGREGDIERVAALVRTPADGEKNYTVVPIVGMAGVGKTVLVQHVCDMAAIRSHFDVMLWVWVSQEFDVVSVARKIVEAITRSRPGCDELSTLHELIVEQLAGKRCLIVLDDVWDDNPRHWDCITAPLSRCAAGSTVVVTTRSKKVAKMLNPKVYHLKCLSDNDCWLVCWRRTLQNRKTNIGKELEEIGKLIAKKCGGLPLAAEAAGSALSTSITWEHWKEVLENGLWVASEVKNLVLPVLKVSYDHLSMPLKRCFAFCSLFPKGFALDKDVLVQLWTAQGFVDAEGDCSPEVIASGYFNDLVSRCFFHPSPAHGISEGKFVMHDLYQELAQFVSEQDHEEMTIRTKIPSELITDFECLRALDLSNTNIMELPKSIGSLIHLRYLGLDNTAIQTLPESICALFHLETIKLNHCSSLTQLPQGIGELTRLQRLPLFAIRNEPSGCGIEELNELVNLRGQLHITGLNNLDGSQAAAANLWNKLGIQKLTLEWSELTNFNKSLCDPQGIAVSGISDSQGPGSSAAKDQVLKCLKPHSNLEELSIKNYNGPFSPTWSGWLPLDRLASIELKDCHNCEELPPLGCLPSLKHILIQSLPSIKVVGPEFFGNVGDIASSSASRVRNVFPALESLKFSNMKAWEEWCGVKSQHFPTLKYLRITRCSKLKLLPKFTSEPKLIIRHCDLLQMPLCQKYRNTVKRIPAQSEISCTCITEGDILILEASCSYGA